MSGARLRVDHDRDVRSWLVLVIAACSRSHAPPELDAWARKVLALPLDQVCATDADHPVGIYGTFTPARDCLVRPSLVTPEIRALGANYIFRSSTRAGAGYLVLDWGGGFVDAYGVLVGAPGFVPDPNEGQPTQRLRDGVYSFKTEE